MSPERFRASIKAAGGVLYRPNEDGEREFLLVHRPRYDDWSLPKGKLDRKEGFLEAGLREVREETGIQANYPIEIGSVGYETDAGNRKVVRWWLMEAVGGKFRPNSEVDTVAWLNFRKATKRLQYTNDQKVLRRANALADDPTYAKIYLVRHAQAGVKAQWKGKDHKRPLDRRGRKQAIDLAVRFKAHPITSILTSPYQRCLQTAKPLENAIRLTAETDRRLSVDGSAGDVLNLIRELKGEAVVIITHGEVISAVMGSLAADGLDLDGPMEWKKGSVWVLEAKKGKIRSGRYVPPKR
ncbi:MAG: NUDIX hydrolase [Actinomycetia bacterium]|nr:NUDIX hydrolase [Actinomycetes bacterium]